MKNLWLGLYITVLVTAVAFATTVLRPQDFDDSTFIGGVVINGLRDLGRTNNTALQTTACDGHPTMLCRAQSATDGDVYTSTGPATGQWRNQRTGVGP